MPFRSDPGTRRELKARLLLVTAHIEWLRELDPDDPLREALGSKIDEAAELLKGIGGLDDQQQSLADAVTSAPRTSPAT
jgi:hypothetical protein